jgi:hypothetical protein
MSDLSPPNESEITELVTDINSNDVNTIANLYSTNYQSLFDNAGTLTTYLQQEQDRITEKQTAIQNALYNQQRTVELNDNYRKRVSAYNSILLVACVSFFTILVILILRTFVTFIPSILYDILIILIIGFMVIYGIRQYQTIK